MLTSQKIDVHINVTFSSSILQIIHRSSSTSSSYRSDGNDIRPCYSSFVILIYRERKKEKNTRTRLRERPSI